MSRVYEHITDYIQHPALVKVNDKLYMACFQWIKLCSILEIIKTALKNKVIKEGDTIIDSSSGTYAYSLALACNKYKLKCVIVGSTSINHELTTMIELLGGKVFIIDKGAYSQQARVEFVKELLSKNKDYFWTEQYNNKDHYIGYKILAKQILKAFPNKQVNLISGVGTGASSIGVYLYLKKKQQNIKLIAIDTFGSISFKSDKVIDPSITGGLGIGSNMKFETLDQSLYTKTHWLSADLMKHFTIKLYKEQAIFAGATSGACYGVGLFESNLSKNNNDVFIALAGDMGYRYFNSIYDKHNEYEQITPPPPQEIFNINNLMLPWSYKNH